MAATIQPKYSEFCKVDVPEGKCGQWAVERWSVDDKAEAFNQLRMMLNPHRPQRHVPAGEYTRLTHCGATIMSDTPDEIRDHARPIRYATGGGHFLINGLGLGMVANACLENGAERVTCVEISPDVISLVARHWTDKWGDRLQIVHANALEYQPPKGARYRFVWHDIWPTICGDNLPEMVRLHRKYGRRCDDQGSWARGLCELSRERAFR